VEGSGGERKKQSGGEEFDGTGQACQRGYLHGGSLVRSVRDGQDGGDDFYGAEGRCIQDIGTLGTRDIGLMAGKERV
jgi:hypothetical protein